MFFKKKKKAKKKSSLYITLKMITKNYKIKL